MTTLRMAVKAFFEIKEHETLASAEGAKQIAIITAGRAFYSYIDYLIAAVLGAMVVWMNVHGFSGKEIFLATWLYDFVAAGAFYLLSNVSGYDITLGKSFRRAADVISGKSFLLGALLILAVSIKAIIWEGPEVICFLFKKEIGSPIRMFLSLLILSALQGAFGAWLYTTGYKLWNMIF